MDWRRLLHHCQIQFRELIIIAARPNKAHTLHIQTSVKGNLRGFRCGLGASHAHHLLIIMAVLTPEMSNAHLHHQLSRRCRRLVCCRLHALMRLHVCIRSGLCLPVCAALGGLSNALIIILHTRYLVGYGAMSDIRIFAASAETANYALNSM
jgi:hypothetical protein